VSKKRPTNGIVYSTEPGFVPLQEQAAASETLPPAKQPLRIRLDTKHRSGKAVTLVEHFVGKEEDLEALGKRLKNLCGAGGSVKDGIAIIQGDHRPKVLTWLKNNGYTQSK